MQTKKTTKKSTKSTEVFTGHPFKDIVCQAPPDREQARAPIDLKSARAKIKRENAKFRKF